jgi:hypothetical protein
MGADNKLNERKHAKFSASGAARWLACPGSVKLTEKAPPQASSKWADEGTAAHACLEAILTKPNRRLAVETQLRAQNPESMVTDVATAADWIFDQMTEGVQLDSEIKVLLPVSEPDTFGTCDALLVELFGTLTVVDFKYGVKVVDPKENPQLMYYAIGAAHKYGYNFTNVRLVIIQPRAEDLGDAIKEWTTPIETVIAWREGDSGLQVRQSPARCGISLQVLPRGFDLPRGFNPCACRSAPRLFARQ